MDIDLAAAVTALRDELLEAAARHDPGQHIGFKVGPIELEFAVELRADAKAKTGFKAWVLSADAEVGAARARTHKVKLTVTPTTPDGGDLMISGDPARAPGPGVEGEDDLQR
ncbi:trypco2 family protein [Kibdelosporangium aridum]|uniref:trypco2 family protein n=1 Tax=Kibdelosporangium aridum TaxID=2030 RepID=UPI0005260161